MCCQSCLRSLSCLLDVWMLGQLYWLPSLVRQVHVQAERERRERERRRASWGIRSGRQSPDDRTTRRSSSIQPRHSIEFMYHFVYLCIIYDLCFNACLHNKLVSSSPRSSSIFSYLLPCCAARYKVTFDEQFSR